MTADSATVVAAGYSPMDIVSYRGRVWRAAGGTAGNVAAILGFLGWKSSLVADLGADLAGDQARADLMRSNVSVEMVRLIHGTMTPRLVHEISATGHRYLFKCPKCSQSFPTSRPLRLERGRELMETVTAPNVFFFDRLNAATILLAEHFAASGSTVVFEPSRPARADLAIRAMAVANIIKQSDDRETGLKGAAASSSRQLWIITGGSQGARYRLGNGAWHASPAFSYPVVDAGGAGDWTTAGLIHTLSLRDRFKVQEIGEALRWAQALAAVSCGAPGARGLARAQTAEAVVRAAQFVQHTDERPASNGGEFAEVDQTSPGSACRTCLLPDSSGKAASKRALA
jgi:fructokinase